MDLESALNDISDKDSFADFLLALRENLMLDCSDWENPTLDRFLEAMEAWVRAMESYSENTNDNEVKKPGWKTFAKILLASKYYE